MPLPYTRKVSLNYLVILTKQFCALLHENNNNYICMLYVCSIQPRVVPSAPRKTEKNSHSHMQCCMQQPLSTPTHHLNSMTSGTCHLLHIRYHMEWYIIIQTNYAMNKLYNVHMHWQCICALDALGKSSL